jgi:hypothetical protein
MKAGVPYLVMWGNEGTTITNPIFTGVTIDATALTSLDRSVTSRDDKVRFIGNYDRVPLYANDKTKLYLGSNSTLYYPGTDMTVNAFRAYFEVDLGEANEVKTFVLGFGEDDATGIITIENDQYPMGNNSGWYDLNGRRLNGQPTQKGIYINNGRKHIIK